MIWNKVIWAALACLLYVSMLAIVYLIHINFLPVNVVFYASIFDGVIAAILTGAIVYFLPTFGLFTLFEKVQLFAIFILGGYIFAISIPTVIDRSLSFYILEKLQQRGGAIELDAFEQVFTTEYVVEHRLVDVRLTEQQESGTIAIEDGCVKLTGKGRTLAGASRWFRQNMLPKKRLLMGEYTDDLTDPFRNSVEAPDYSCN